MNAGQIFAGMPKRSDDVRDYEDALSEYLELTGKINTSYGNVSSLKGPLHSFSSRQPGDRISALANLSEHFEEVSSWIERAFELSNVLRVMIENEIDKEAEQYERDLWNYKESIDKN